MRKLSGFTVVVSGGKSESKNPVVENTTAGVKKETINIDMKNRKVDDIVSVGETSPTNYFKALYAILKNDQMEVEDIAHMIILELKRVYIECIGDECSVEENKYLDNLIFNQIERFLIDIIDSSNNDARYYLANEYKEILRRSFMNSTKILGYEDKFDEEKFMKVINRFVDDFNQ